VRNKFSILNFHFTAILILTNSISISRSQAPAWERTCRGGSPASRDGRRTEAGADAFPSWGLGTRKNPLYIKMRIAGKDFALEPNALLTGFEISGILTENLSEHCKLYDGHQRHIRECRKNDLRLF
jgi:hypothetical protein